MRNSLLHCYRTALHIACASGHVEVVQFLVESKAKLNLCDNQNRSALMKVILDGEIPRQNDSSFNVKYIARIIVGYSPHTLFQALFRPLHSCHFSTISGSAVPA